MNKGDECKREIERGLMVRRKRERKRGRRKGERKRDRQRE
jgi:hypothetical protein